MRTILYVAADITPTGCLHPVPLDNATAGMKNLVASRHTDKGGKVKTLTIESGADATDADATDDSSDAIMRVGTVMAYVVGPDGTKPGDLQRFA